MPLDRALPFAVFFFVMTVTPGPNNVMLLASGLNFGLRRTFPHMVGIVIGLMTLIVAVGLGLGQVFRQFPAVQIVLQIVGTAYLVWLAWRIANAAAPEAGQDASRPMTLIEAALYQWLNPKAWLMAISAIANYVEPGTLQATLVAMSVIIAVVCPPGMVPWVVGGVLLRSALQDSRTRRVFNWVMALLLLASLWPVVADLVAR